MLQPISLPKQLRREIIALVKLDPGAEEEVAFQINHIKLDIVDIACSALQDTRPTSEMDTQFTEVLNEINRLANDPSLSSTQKYVVQDLERHLQEIRLICLNPLLTGELQNEKYPLPSYSNLTETVLLANGQLMAESFRLFLESFGIQAILGRESAGVVYGLTVGPLGEVDIKVSSANAVDARILLDAMQKGYFVFEQESLEDETTDNSEFDDDTDESESDLPDSNL